MHENISNWANSQRNQLIEQMAAHTAELPLRYLRQHAHYTTPAGNAAIAEKAVTRGFAPLEKILAKYDIALQDLAATLEAPLGEIEALLGRDPHAPLVVLDLEDAQAPDEDSHQRGRANAIHLFRAVAWGDSLRYYRPAGFQLDACVDDIVTVLTEAGQGRPPEAFPIDGLIFPKLEHPAEAVWLCQLLGRVEEQLGLEQNQIKLQFLVESAWAVINLPQLVAETRPRLTGIVFGTADYSADLALPDIRFDHPVCDWARAQVVNAAAAVGVPPIDAMTLNYPVADPHLSPAENRARILGRLKECYDDTWHGIHMGMKGKWVGHPAQLFVTLLAHHLHLSRTVASELDKIKAYRAAVQAGQAVTVIEGVMSDRATDRHARARLREGVASGLIAWEEARAFGLIDE